jgi:hypothetical protein
MKIEYGDLTINGNVVTYENAVKIEAGSKTRRFHPQINGDLIITTDISTNMSKITIPIRVTPQSNNTFDDLYDNDDNNIITFRDKNFTGCAMEVIPEREDREIVEYVFMGNPEV